MPVLLKQLHSFLRTYHRLLVRIGIEVCVAIIIVLIIIATVSIQKVKNQNLQAIVLNQKIQTINRAYLTLKNVDQYKRNQELAATISAMQKTYAQTADEYQNLLDLKQNLKDTSSYDTLFAQILHELSQDNFSSGAADLALLSTNITDEQNKLAAASVPTVPQSATQSNTAPSNGHSRQSVSTDVGTFVVDIVAADLSSTKIIVDTASTGDCSNNCPTLPLSDYVSRNGAYAGINGSYFCPAEYPSCADKTGSFDLLVMNKNKVYFNSANNVYSTNPLVVFGSGFIRFISAAENWGRDTSVDSVLSNYPMLVSGGNIVYGGSGDQKFNSIGPRSFIANKGSTAFIGFVYNATMSDSAHVMKALGMDNAMNLDEGGSTALMFNGSYLAGPGRNIPNAILFVRK